MTLSDIKNILETYKLYEFLFLIPILLFALWCGFIGFIRGVRKERFKAIFVNNIIKVTNFGEKTFTNYGSVTS